MSTAYELLYADTRWSQRVVCVSGTLREGEGADKDKTRRRLLVGATDSSTTRTENIRHFEYRVVNECTVRIPSEWTAATRYSPRNLAHVSAYRTAKK
jgi:hypothetical protein